MSLYRQAGQERRRRRLIAALGGVGLLLVIGAIVLAATSGDGDSAADKAAKARGAVEQARNGLELLTIEYGQAVKGGTVVAPTEYAAAQADVKRAQDALAGVRANLPAAAYDKSAAAFAQVADVVAARGSATELEDAIDSARGTLDALAR